MPTHQASLRCNKLSKTGLTFAFGHMATPVPHFVAFEMRRIDALCRLRFLADPRRGAFISVRRMEAVIYMAPEVFRAMKPRSGADKDAVVEPLRAVVAGGSTPIRRDVIITIRTIGCQ